MSGVEYIGKMFNGAKSFTHDLNRWDTNAVRAFKRNDRTAASLQLIFAGSALNDYGLSPCWYVIPTAGHGSGCPFAVGDEDAQDVMNAYANDNSNATYTFGEIGSLDMSGVSDMAFLFANNVDFNEDITLWDTSNVRTLAFHAGRSTQGFADSTRGL